LDRRNVVDDTRELGRPNLTPVSLLIPPDMLARLDKAAARELRSRSSMVRVILDGALKNAQASPAMAAGGHS
jgi:metal-responsive CopG/Arc/MetJ family transcriptional regulator